MFLTLFVVVLIGMLIKEDYPSAPFLVFAVCETVIYVTLAITGVI